MGGRYHQNAVCGSPREEVDWSLCELLLSRVGFLPCQHGRWRGNGVRGIQQVRILLAP